MVETSKSNVTSKFNDTSEFNRVPAPRSSAERELQNGFGECDHRPRYLRWLMPMACSSAVPLNGMQQAELKLIAYH